MPLTVMTPRFREALNRIFVSKRGGVQDLQVLDDVFPTISLVDPAQDENHLPRSEISFSCGSGIGAYGAGTWSAAAINNESTVANPYLLVIEHLWVTPAAAEIFRGGIFPALQTLAQPFGMYALDKRRGLSGLVPSLSAGGVNIGAAASPFGLWLRANAAVATDLIGTGEGWIVGPGASFMCSGVTVNSGLEAMFQGYVRPLDLAELA
ncbi:MAG: hypothetical protein NTU93_00030 [Arthrobacter sp.]|nr:hypothetical protein [Arthrobacter sp.]